MTMDYQPLGALGAEQVAAEAAKRCAGDSGNVLMLAYTPWDAAFARLSSGSWVSAPSGPWRGGAPPWLEVFELRAFSLTAEVRWTHEADGLGAAVLVEGLAGGGNAESGSAYQRKLWGRGARDDSGWVGLREPRIGTLWVPAPSDGPKPPGEGALVLLAREARVQDQHGNWSVSDERWLGLGWV